MPNTKAHIERYILLIIVALLIAIPTAGFIYFAVQYNNLRTSAAELLATSHTQAEENAYYNDIDNDYYDCYYDTCENLLQNAYTTLDEADIPLEEIPAYQLLYPELYVGHDFRQIIETQKTIYLTFDDGPTSLTNNILNILRDHDVQATFFVVYRNTAEARALYQRIVDEGHTLGLHSGSHNYRNIYASVESFLSDIAILSNMLEDVTGVKPEILRFPGGSINVFNRMIHRELSAEMLRRGYVYFDWDVSAVDMSPNATATTVRNNVLNGVDGKDRAIVLMHDAGNAATASALPGIIEALRDAGYTFAPLDRTIRPVRFNYVPEI